MDEVSLQVNREDRLGLVGPNGAGKSTLFSLILGQSEPDAGVISMQRNVSLGFLPQESAPVGEETVIELAIAIHPDMVPSRRLMLTDDPEHYHAKARYEELDGYNVEAKAKAILAGLSFREKDFERPCRELSGGWVMRAHLARLLVQEPDLLMLDEPTNHLDLESLLWFQQYLHAYPGAILMISHDREFLNDLVTGIVEIRQRQLVRYRGNYDEFLLQRKAQEEQLLARYKNQQREIAHLMEFVDRFRAKNTKAAQAQSKLKQIERMEKIEAPVSDAITIDFIFPQPERSGLRVIRLANVRHAYGANVVYDQLNFEVERGQRIVLVGPNGAGKSTLLKLLAGAMPIQSGSRELGHNARSGYFAQYRADTLNLERTVLEEALDTPQRITEQNVRTLLGVFLFRGDDVFKRVKVLSGGEKSRLALVKLLLDPPNLLLMDEPTTHLDMPSIDALVNALQQYQGTLVFISHDVHFIRAVANTVVHVNSGKLTTYPGNYQYYLDKTAATSARSALVAGNKPSQPVEPERKPAKTKEQKRLEAEERQAKSKLKKEKQNAVTVLENEIAQLEQRQAALTEELEKPETYQQPGAAMRINRELTEVQDRLETVTAEWEKAASALAEQETT
ncbi:MAG: ABC-F family ATP-binding cassette domain-containing protein [Verrucomicrobiota bacterium]|nr:ABC-F family ATP-binding cassette domain-containing protein [Verrucomicrobiota bacterium]